METPNQLRARVLAELAEIRPQLDAGLATGRPNAGLAVRIADHISAQPAEWFVARTYDKAALGTSGGELGSYSAGELLRHLAKQAVVGQGATHET